MGLGMLQKRDYRIKGSLQRTCSFQEAINRKMIA